MVALTAEQRSLKSKITTGAIILGVVAGVIVALLAFWLLGNAGDLVRWLGTILLGAGAGYGAYRLRYNSGVAKAVCPKCGTAFGIREVERHEAVIGSEQRQKTEPLRPPSATDRGANKVTTWLEEKVEVTAIDECFKCHDRTERKWTTTRERDKEEEEVVIAAMGSNLAGRPLQPPAPPPAPPAAPPAPPTPPAVQTPPVPPAPPSPPERPVVPPPRPPRGS